MVCQESRSRSPAPPPAGLAGLAHRQFLGPAEPPEPPPLTLADLPDDVPISALDALRRHHR